MDPVDPVITLDSGTLVTRHGQTIHPLTPEAVNVLWCAEKPGVAVFARQAPEFAEDHDDDTVIIVLRGRKAVALGREPLNVVVNLLRETL